MSASRDAQAESNTGDGSAAASFSTLPAHNVIPGVVDPETGEFICKVPLPVGGFCEAKLTNMSPHIRSHKQMAHYGFNRDRPTQWRSLASKSRDGGIKCVFCSSVFSTGSSLVEHHLDHPETHDDTEVEEILTCYPELLYWPLK
ncbi:hypothetical protein PG994_014545 [Apiospora phragmitis]|uniref:C2H2-type domain-containing protein n=1 Tax=Apiospora phragmitis TaxID=2905665 RepID=A0ABR1T716_9PEZI